MEFAQHDRAEVLYREFPSITLCDTGHPMWPNSTSSILKYCFSIFRFANIHIELLCPGLHILEDDTRFHPPKYPSPIFHA